MHFETEEGKVQEESIPLGKQVEQEHPVGLITNAPWHKSKATSISIKEAKKQGTF